MVYNLGHYLTLRMWGDGILIGILVTQVYILVITW